MTDNHPIAEIPPLPHSSVPQDSALLIIRDARTCFHYLHNIERGNADHSTPYSLVFVTENQPGCFLTSIHFTDDTEARHFTDSANRALRLSKDEVEAIIGTTMGFPDPSTFTRMTIPEPSPQLPLTPPPFSFVPVLLENGPDPQTQWSKLIIASPLPPDVSLLLPSGIDQEKHDPAIFLCTHHTVNIVLHTNDLHRAQQATNVLNARLGPPPDYWTTPQFRQLLEQINAALLAGVQ